MAAELTYRTIFSLIPVVVLGLVMFRIFGGLEDVQHKVENQLYSFFGVPDVPANYLQEPDYLQEPSEPPASAEAEALSDAAAMEAAEPPAASGDQIDLQAAISISEQIAQSKAEAVEETRRETRASIRRTLHEVTAQVASLDFKSIGVFGLILFIYAAVALADSTEHLFNRIYDAPAQRPIHLRIAIHWSIITLGSGLLAMSLYLSSQVVDWFGTIGAGSTTKVVLNHLLSIGASWVLLFLLYALMPNTRVAVQAAAVGSLVGSLLWEAAKFGFQIYVVKAVPYSAIYGSIGLIPLFLLWIYVTWLIVLFGLILTYTLQTLGGRSLRRVELTDENSLLVADPDWMLPIMCEVGHAFATGNAINHQQLADRIGLSSRIVHDMTNKLVDAQLLRRVSGSVGQQDAVTLSRPAEKIAIGEILALAHRVRPTSDHPAWKTLAGLKQAEREAADGKTLANVLLW
jgi:membrane protein